MSSREPAWRAGPIAITAAAKREVERDAIDRHERDEEARGSIAKLGPGPAWPLGFMVTSAVFVVRDRVFVEAPLVVVDPR